jgi:ubiquinone/menaquinone biosynthesis C-methylase UbiE
MRKDGDSGPEIGSYFDRTAKTFDGLYSPGGQNAVMRWVNSRFRRDIAERFLLTMEHVRRTAPESVLDVGCGSGRYIAQLAEAGATRIVGIDLSIEMLELARAQARQVTGTRIDFIHGDFSDWSAGEEFDLIVAMGFFDYVQDPAVLLKKMRALCSKSVIASFPSRHWFRTPLRRVRYRLKNCPVYFYSAEQIGRLGHEAGFAHTDLVKIRGAGMDYVATFWCR